MSQKTIKPREAKINKCLGIKVHRRLPTDGFSVRVEYNTA